MNFESLSSLVRTYGIHGISPIRLDGEPMATLKLLELLTDTVMYAPRPKYWMKLLENKEN